MKENITTLMEALLTLMILFFCAFCICAAVISIDEYFKQQTIEEIK